MKFLNDFLFFLIFVVSFQEPPGARASSVFDRDDALGVVTTCGETLSDETGGIWYNYPGTYTINDRCVWVLRVENATGYNIEILRFNPPYYDPVPYISHQVSFTGFNINNVTQTEHHLLNHTDQHLLKFNNSNIVVVVLQTSFFPHFTSPQGIVLSYNATFSAGISKPSKFSTDFYLEAVEAPQTLELTQKLNETSITNQLSTVVVTILTRNYGQGGRLNTSSSHSRPENCNNQIMYYYSYRHLIGEWDYHSSSCQYYTGFSIDTPDIALFIFRSNEENHGPSIAVGCYQS